MLVSWQSDADAADTQSKHPASSAAAYSAAVELSENGQTAFDTGSPTIFSIIPGSFEQFLLG